MLAATSWDAEGMRNLVAGGADPTKKTEMQSGVVIGKDRMIEPFLAAKLVEGASSSLMRLALGKLLH